MEIKDLQGKTITITDLDGTIAMVADFMGYTHIDADESLQRFDRNRKAYWKGIYEQLTALKKQAENKEDKQSTNQ